MDTKEEDGMICKKITSLLIRTSLVGSDNLCHTFEFGSQCTFVRSIPVVCNCTFSFSSVENGSTAICDTVRHCNNHINPLCHQCWSSVRIIFMLQGICRVENINVHRSIALASFSSTHHTGRHTSHTGTEAL